MTIDTVINNVKQIPSTIEINKINAVQLVVDNNRRTMLRVDLDCPTDEFCVIIGPTQALVEALKGEIIGQSFSGNDARFVPTVIFTTDSAAQEQKWAIMTPGSPSPTTDLIVNEYIG